MKSIGPIIENTQAFIIYETFKAYNDKLVYIGKDDREIINIYNKLIWLMPKQKILLYKAWDQIPYDNISPSKNLQTSRLETLYYLEANKEEKIIILTTINSVIQKTLPKAELKKNFIRISKNSKLDINKFLSILIKLGYEKNSNVRDKSEFAIRGSIIDIFLPQFDKPIRIDLFDNYIESIFEFDPITQIRKNKSELKKFTINPSSELIIDTVNLENFRSRFREIFQNYRKSQVYQFFSEGIIPAGGEQYLPLFYKKLNSLFDYLENYKLLIHNDLINLFEERIENLNDYYNARIQSNDSFYLNPSFLYLNEEYFNKIINKFEILKLSPFYNENFISSNIKKINNLSSIRKEIDFNFIKHFFEINSKENKIIICCKSHGSLDRVYKILNQNIQIFPIEIKSIDHLSNENIYITVLNIEESFRLNNLIYINEKSLFGYFLTVKSNQKKQKQQFLFEELNKLSKGVLLVHNEYGICRFNNIKKIILDESIHDCLELEFADNQKLLLPVENLNYITKYGNEDENNINLDKLGASNWQKRKAAAKKKIKEAAKKLIKIASNRFQSKSLPININNDEYDKFCSTFPFVETDDQLNAINDVLNDFNKGIPSDRLIVGDVAFGKTEVIIRALFLAAKSNVQSIVFVPTTLLSRQHYNNFKKRFSQFNIKISEISRLVLNKDKLKIYKECSEGKIDILIGTHALLSDNLSFKNLGLIIYDEEQKLGTLQKEKFKEIAPNAHVLSLSATPIPRTLSMSLSGIRDLSLILTAPFERLAVRSYVSEFDEITISEAIKREIYGRKNGVYFVTPRKKDIPFIEKFLNEKLPEIKYVVAHGQLSPTILETRISKFYNQEVPLMVSTNIVENGLDLPHVNTIIVYRSNLFSLATLYQLKGRVGRSSKRGYAYMTYKENELKDNGKKRLSIINSSDSLGSGFSIASQDLDMRGGGSIIGEEQSGFIKEIGTELYHQMLEEEILLNKQNLSNYHIDNKIFQPSIKIPEEIFIPENYIDDLDLRLSIYKRISNLYNIDDLSNLIIELIDRFGNIPKQLQNLFSLIEIKLLCIKYNIDQFEFSRKGIVIGFYKKRPLNPNKIFNLSMIKNTQYILRPDQKIFYDFKGVLNENRFNLSKKILKEIN
tara:strand:+ start:20859 stop:24236 length:3378 start_codon:yes stop_codon:yes gene_type:complete